MSLAVHFHRRFVRITCGAGRGRASLLANLDDGLSKPSRGTGHPLAYSPNQATHLPAVIELGEDAGPGDAGLHLRVDAVDRVHGGLVARRLEREAADTAGVNKEAGSGVLL